jgi:hypothetical protein
VQLLSSVIVERPIAVDILVAVAIGATIGLVCRRRPPLALLSTTVALVSLSILDQWLGGHGAPGSFHDHFAGVMLALPILLIFYYAPAVFGTFAAIVGWRWWRNHRPSRTPDDASNV